MHSTFSMRPSALRSPGLRSQRTVHSRLVTCNASGLKPEGDEDWGKLASEVLQNDPSAMEKLNRVADAAKRVAELQAMQAEYQKAIEELAQNEAKEIRSQGAQLPASVVSTIEVELAAAAAAERALQEAQEARDKLQLESRVMEERFRSLVAGVVAAAGGTIGYLPYTLSTYGNGPRSVLGIVMVLASTFLFGATYRYLLGTGNPKLKQGAVGAFAIVRGVSLIEEKLSPVASQGVAGITPQIIYDCSVDLGESFIVFLFAAAALEFALKQGWTTPGTDL